MWEAKIEQEAISNPVLASQSAKNISLGEPISSMVCYSCNGNRKLETTTIVSDLINLTEHLLD